MKLIRITTAFILFTAFGYAQFQGGQADGIARLRLTNTICSVVNVNPFTGGQADGNSNLRLVNLVCPVTNVNPFVGGQADGNSNLRLINIVCPVVNVNPFIGGQADGNSNLRLSNVVCPVVNVNPFTGGQADGNSNLRMSNIVCTVTNVNPFIGGNADGIGNLRLENVSRAMCISIVLPIELLTFDAQANGNVVDVTWTTLSEINNDYFTVERSKDAINYESIAIVDGAGYSTQPLYYTLIDKAPYEGLSYYRLKQTDFNGDYFYSPKVAVEINDPVYFLDISPNPISTKDEVSFLIAGNRGEDVLVKIHDVLGNEILSEQINLSSTHANISLDQHLAAGTYLITADFSGKEVKQKLVVY